MKIKKFFLWIFIAGFVGGGGYLIFLGLGNLEIIEINCSSQYGPCNTTVRVQLENFEGEPWLVARRGIKEVLQNSKIVEDYSIQIVSVNKLDVNIAETKAHIAVKILDSDSYTLLDKSGKVLETRSDTSLPAILVDGKSVTNEELTQSMGFLIELLSDLYANLNVREGRLVKDGFEIVLNGRIKVIFPKKGESDVLVGSLNLILSNLDKEFSPTLIDLRYKNPVVK